MSSTLKSLKARSASPRELVLTYEDALSALDELEQHGAKVLGWEGWLRYADGRVGHSSDHQGSADLSGLNPTAAYKFCRTTIRDAYEQFSVQPEGSATELLFCIGHDV
jgi:hypothetical protein